MISGLVFACMFKFLSIEGLNLLAIFFMKKKITGGKIGNQKFDKASKAVGTRHALCIAI